MRLYLIGAGVIARTHAEATKKLPESFEIRVADPNPAALEAFLEKFPDAVSFPDMHAMLASEEPRADDIVIVATPPFIHLEPTKAALASGRHTLCEKPLAMNVEEAEEMLAFARSKGLLLGCCSVRFKGMHHMETVKQVLRSGQLGDIYHMTFVNKWERSRSGIEYQPESRWFLDSSRSGGGVLMDWGPYDFTTLFDLLEPTQVDVRGAWTAQPHTAVDPTDIPFDVETHVGAFLTFHSSAGRPIHVHYERASCAHGKEYVHAEIEGTFGAVRWTPFDSRQPVFRRYDVDGKLVEEEVPMPPRTGFTIMDNPLLHFSRKVQGLPSLANVDSRAVDPFRCIRAVYEVIQTGDVKTIPVEAPQEG